MKRSRARAPARSLGRRGITSLLVVDERAEREGFEAGRARVEERLAHLFRKCSGRACAELRRQVEDFRMDELA